MSDSSQDLMTIPSPEGGVAAVGRSLRTPFGDVDVSRMAPIAALCFVGAIVLSQLVGFRMSGLLVVSPYLGVAARDVRPPLVAVVIENLVPVVILVVVLAVTARFILGAKNTLWRLAVLIPIARLPVVVLGCLVGGLLLSDATTQRVEGVAQAGQSIVLVIQLYLYYGAFICAVRKERFRWRGYLGLLAALAVAFIVKQSVLGAASQLTGVRPTGPVAPPQVANLPYQDGECVEFSVAPFRSDAPGEQRIRLFFERTGEDGLRLVRQRWVSPEAEHPRGVCRSTFLTPELASLETVLEWRADKREGGVDLHVVAITFEGEEATVVQSLNGEEKRTREIKAPLYTCWQEDLLVLASAMPLADGYRAVYPILGGGLVPRYWALECRLAAKPDWLGGNGEGECLLVSFTQDLFNEPLYGYYDSDTRALLGVDLVVERQVRERVIASRPAPASQPAK